MTSEHIAYLKKCQGSLEQDLKSSFKFSDDETTVNTDELNAILMLSKIELQRMIENEKNNTN